MNYLIWLLIVYGTTTLITRAIIFRPLRNLYFGIPDNASGIWTTFWRCHWCVGFWVGFGLWWTTYSITNSPLLDGVLGSSINILLFPLTFLSLWTEAKAQ